MDNTIHFQNYNSGLATERGWHDNIFFINLEQQRRKRFAKIASEKKRNIARRELQASILQLLIDAKREPVHINNIANHIGRSRLSTLRFLSTQNDDFWIEYQGDTSRWWTSLQDLPDRLFY